MIYLYDRSHETAPPTLWQTLGYFFLLPNVCFPLFPVVDFKKFCRNYYDEERHKIYQVGIEWIWRGLVQLILYRLIYYHLTLDPVAVANLGDLAVYMLSTFMLYIRISGHFHLVIGMLHLFGFNLPETHHRYFLASSFTDFWRRINIYWKDFMMKVFYYPAFFRLRRLGNTTALVLATAFTFLVTWLLHLVQWFWIRGSLLIEWNDVIFWTILAALVHREFPLRIEAWPRPRAHTRADRARKRRPRAANGWHFFSALRAVVVLGRRIGFRLDAHGPVRLDPAAVDIPSGRTRRCRADCRGCTGRLRRLEGVGRRGSAAGRPSASVDRAWRRLPACACLRFRQSPTALVSGTSSTR